MKAKAFLQQIQKLDYMIANKREEREQWLLLATSTTAGAIPETGVRVQSSGSQQKMADAINESIDISREIDRIIQQLGKARQDIISVIERLDVTDYDLLHKLYVGRVVKQKSGLPRICCMTLQEVADANGKSYSWATTQHGIALKNVQRIIDAQNVVPVEYLLREWHAQHDQTPIV